MYFFPSLFLFSYECFVFFFLRATPAAYESSQAKCPNRAAAASLHHSHSNARSLTHWVRPWIELESSWVLAGFITCWVTTGIPQMHIFLHLIFLVHQYSFLLYLSCFRHIHLVPFFFIKIYSSQMQSSILTTYFW